VLRVAAGVGIVLRDAWCLQEANPWQAGYPSSLQLFVGSCKGGE